jgi:hypothetical protein
MGAELSWSLHQGAFLLGDTMARMKNKVRVAIIGVGNCAAALVQGVEFYKNAADDEAHQMTEAYISGEV